MIEDEMSESLKVKGLKVKDASDSSSSDLRL